MSRSKYYDPVKGHKSIERHKHTKNFKAEFRFKGKYYTETFSNLHDAVQWKKFIRGESKVKVETSSVNQFSTLKKVWETMQELHFPTLATSTRQIWKRRFKQWEAYQHLTMDSITPTRVTTIVNKWVKEFSKDEYQSRRGGAGRCNMNNELNMFVTIFNWYKESEVFENEAQKLTCPIKRKHRDQGFIKPVPLKKKQIDPDSAFIFFECLPCLYQDLAIAQFLIAGRVGETCGIQWSNIDLNNNRLIIKESVVWGQSSKGSKSFLELKPFPKNKEPRPVYITDELAAVFQRRAAFKKKGCNYVFHVDGRPLNYGTIQKNYRDAQRKSGIPYTGTHILRYGLARIARKLGGIEAVMSVTGHKDYKMADHYSRSYEEDNEKVTKEVMEFLRSKNSSVMPKLDMSNTISSMPTESSKDSLINQLLNGNSPQIEDALIALVDQIKIKRDNTSPETISQQEVGNADVISLFKYKKDGLQ